MFEVIKRITLLLIVGLCIAGLSLHFAVESLGGIQGHPIGSHVCRVGFYGAVAYTSTMADADFYESEWEREYRYIHQMPHLEREEVRTIYSEKRFKGDLLTRIVDTITANQDIWVAAMMTEEHRLIPVDRTEAFRAAIVVGVSAVIGSLIPLAPFAVLPVEMCIWVSILVPALVLFGVGAYKARITVGRPWRSGLEMAVIGTVSALAGYAIGIPLRVPAVS